MSLAIPARPVVLYAAVATAVYLAASLVALSVPALLDRPGEGLAIAGGAVILLVLGILPVILILRAGLGIPSAALVAAAVVLVAQVALVGLGAAGIPGLLAWDRPPGEVVLTALRDAVVFALFALVPAAIAGVFTSLGLRLRRARRAG